MQFISKLFVIEIYFFISQGGLSSGLRATLQLVNILMQPRFQKIQRIKMY